MKPKLLVISSRVPYPLDKGDKLRLYHQLRFLKQSYEICLISLDDAKTDTTSIDKLKTIVDEVHVIQLPKWKIYLNLLIGFAGRKPFQVYYFYQRSAHKKVKSIVASFQPDHIYCQLLRSAEYVKDFHTIRKTLDYQDAFSKGIERRIATVGWKKFIFETEHKRLLKYENIIFDYFDHKTIISEEDRNAIFHEQRKKIHIIPNGIDTTFFLRKEVQEKKYDLLFVGNMSYAPNISSAKYISEILFPELVRLYPKIKILIAGANPTPEVKKLQNDNIEISGWIDDIRNAYNSSKIFIAPMQLGSGLQNKLLEAMSMELPCIMSKLANKSLKAIHNETAIVCETKEDYINAIQLLMENQETCFQLSENGRNFVKNQFSWEKSVEELKRVMDQ